MYLAISYMYHDVVMHDKKKKKKKSHSLHEKEVHEDFDHDHVHLVARFSFQDVVQ